MFDRKLLFQKIKRMGICVVKFMKHHNVILKATAYITSAAILTLSSGLTGSLLNQIELRVLAGEEVSVVQTFIVDENEQEQHMTPDAILTIDNKDQRLHPELPELAEAEAIVKELEGQGQAEEIEEKKEQGSKDDQKIKDDQEPKNNQEIKDNQEAKRDQQVIKNQEIKEDAQVKEDKEAADEKVVKENEEKQEKETKEQASDKAEKSEEPEEKKEAVSEKEKTKQGGMAKGKRESQKSSSVPANTDTKKNTSLKMVYNDSMVMKLSSQELKILQRIVEAEATDGDVYGKILVANVVLNRVLDDDFPDTVKSVVFAKSQFAPTRDGRYWSVSVTDSTIEAVERALAGEDYSKGALYFFARKYTSSKKASWFDNSLKRLFEYGGHEFYKER